MGLTALGAQIMKPQVLKQLHPLSVTELLKQEEELGDWGMTSEEAMTGALGLYQRQQNQGRRWGAQGVTIGEM